MDAVQKPQLNEQDVHSPGIWASAPGTINDCLNRSPWADGSWLRSSNVTAIDLESQNFITSPGDSCKLSLSETAAPSSGREYAMSAAPSILRRSQSAESVDSLTSSVARASLRRSQSMMTDGGKSNVSTDPCDAAVIIGTHKWKSERLSHPPSPVTTKVDLRRRVRKVVRHNIFDWIVAGLIVSNGVLIGIQTEYMAVTNLEDIPPSFQVIEVMFCFAFTFELALRLFAYRCDFFTDSQKWWNIFDFGIVMLQIIEIVIQTMTAGLGFDFTLLRFRRVFRLFRVIRLARTLRLIGELKTIVLSIGGSLKAVFWAGLLFFMLAYIVGTVITQLVHSARLQMQKDGVDVPAELDLYYPSLVTTIYTLLQAISGGIDWGKVCHPLLQYVGIEAGLVFTCYTLFSMVAMMNVVTGVFIDSVMENGRQVKEIRTMCHIQSLFKSLDVHDDGLITWEVFESHLETKQMKDLFKAIDVDIEHARGLFELLDIDDSEAVDVQEFTDGCLKVWAPARGLDLRMMIRDIRKLRHEISSIGQASPSKDGILTLS